MKEISETLDSQFSVMLIVDVFVANLWMPFLLFGAGIRTKIDRWLNADATAVDEPQANVERIQAESARMASFTDLMVIMAIAFGGVAVSHLVADNASVFFSSWLDGVLEANPDSAMIYISSITKGFFWLVVMATAIGIGLSFTPAKHYEGAGASKVGSVFLYVLVATIGMKMDIVSLIDNWSSYGSAVSIGLLWMLVHIVVLLVVAKIIRAPFFFVAVGSQANVGGGIRTHRGQCLFPCPGTRGCVAGSAGLCSWYRGRHRLHGMDARHLHVRPYRFLGVKRPCPALLRLASM